MSIGGTLLVDYGVPPFVYLFNMFILKLFRRNGTFIWPFIEFIGEDTLVYLNMIKVEDMVVFSSPALKRIQKLDYEQDDINTRCHKKDKSV